MSYKAVLFDMDGTLLDTLEDLRDSTNHVLRQMGYPERSLEEMRRFVGNGAEKQIRRAVPEGTSEEKIMETLAAYRAYYQDHCQIKTRVYDGLLDMLSELKAKGIKLAVVSNKPDSAVQKLSREYFGDRMDFAVGPSDGVRCKPYPDMAETALKALGNCKKDACSSEIPSGRADGAERRTGRRRCELGFPLEGSCDRSRREDDRR